MAKTIFTDLRAALISMILFSVICGLIYPLAMTGFAQAFFNRQANGSIVKVDGAAAGSSLVGQSFSDPKYFHPRPSAASGSYEGGVSSGSNLGPSSQDLVDAATANLAQVREENGLAADAKVPADAVTASGSGLDPHISPAYAELQVPRVASERGLSEDVVRRLVDKYTDGRTLWFMGEPRVNVLKLNIALDNLQAS